MRVRVKICGITRPEDGATAARLGADAIGLVFHPPSPRAVTIARAREIVHRLPPFVSVVGLFVDAEPRLIRETLREVPLDLLQFHGDEPPAACRGYGRPYIKALAMHDTMDVRRAAAQYHDAAGLLLDAWHEDLRGGSGRSFDWERFPRELDRPLILAGGLDPENAARAIEATRPWAVDVSSGVEREKGVKDPERMAEFMSAVNGFHRETGH